LSRASRRARGGAAGPSGGGAEIPFDVRYVWFITVRDGQVTHFTDYTLPGQPA
jgi:ketosteroid isomerase-like protein